MQKYDPRLKELKFLVIIINSSPKIFLLLLYIFSILIRICIFKHLGIWEAFLQFRNIVAD